MYSSTQCFAVGSVISSAYSLWKYVDWICAFFWQCGREYHVGCLRESGMEDVS